MHCMKKWMIVLIACILSLNFFPHERKEIIRAEEKVEKKEKKQEEVVKEESTLTLTHFIQTALQPVGTTMYVWGGGWNEEDNGSGIEATTIGVPSRWKDFYEGQNASYDFNNTQYQIHDGLDCSGYVGWLIYNVFEKEDGKPGYVNFADEQIDDFVRFGWGEKIPAHAINSYECGDIMASAGHIYVVFGSCQDGSVLLCHSSPPGVRICGTPAKNGNTRSEAVLLAEQIMSKQYPEWYAKYPNCQVDYTYLTQYDQFRWNDTLKDVDGLKNKTIEEVVECIW